jgi:integrase
MDLAWFLLMLHSGLRTCEVRNLRFTDLNFAARQARIEQSKGLKDRMVCLSEATITALQGYLAVRGPRDALPDHIFFYLPPSAPGQILLLAALTDLWRALRGVCLAPPAAPFLRDALAQRRCTRADGADLAGHKWVDTTLGYARLYDGTVAADYYGAMALVERRLALPEDALAEPPGTGQLLALIDSLREGTLNQDQAETVRRLRAGILALAERENAIQDVKVLAPTD